MTVTDGLCGSCHQWHGPPDHDCPPPRRSITNLDKANQMSPYEYATQNAQQIASERYSGIDACSDKIPSHAEELLTTRATTHGSFAHNSRIGQHLRDFFRAQPGWAVANVRTREVLDYVAGKLSRILSGQPDEPQHWEDIAGYATLVIFPDIQR